MALLLKAPPDKRIVILDTHAWEACCLYFVWVLSCSGFPVMRGTWAKLPVERTAWCTKSEAHLKRSLLLLCWTGPLDTRPVSMPLKIRSNTLCPGNEGGSFIWPIGTWIHLLETVLPTTFTQLQLKEICFSSFFFTHACTHTHTRTLACTHACTCVRARTHTHAHAHTHTLSLTLKQQVKMWTLFFVLKNLDSVQPFGKVAFDKWYIDQKENGETYFELWPFTLWFSPRWASTRWCSWSLRER